MDTVYIEREVIDHPRTQRICERYPDARHITIERHADLFNARSQDFRQQKQNPALILAHKAGKRVHATPPGYHIGGQYNYYFSHMLNCIYDCRYCFLQGMYQSANHVVYVNSEDFMHDITDTAKLNTGDSWFFSGYDCDSLALDPITHFVDDCLDHFSSATQCLAGASYQEYADTTLAGPPGTAQRGGCLQPVTAGHCCSRRARHTIACQAPGCAAEIAGTRLEGRSAFRPAVVCRQFRHPVWRDVRPGLRRTGCCPLSILSAWACSDFPRAFTRNWFDCIPMQECWQHPSSSATA